MTRDHKLILGGAGLGISGCLLAMGVYPWPLMHLMDSSVAQLVTHLMTSKV